MLTLKGMTWDHPRAAESVEAATRAYLETRPDLRIEWDRRPLQSFESQPLETIADDYDFIIIDHPHLGAVMRTGCLRPIGEAKAGPLAAISRDFVGLSFESYIRGGALWALPIDGAVMTQCVRVAAGLGPARNWAEVIERAKTGATVWALKPPHAACSFFTLAANLGAPIEERPDGFTPPAAGARALAAMKAVSDHLDPVCYEMNAIDCLDALTEDERFSNTPLVFSYVNYALEGFRPHRAQFFDIPTLSDAGPVGSTLGGAGFAITAACRHEQEAAAFGLYLASAPVQAGIYAEAGGQPAHAAAWADKRVNAATLDFHTGTRKTIEAAWLRPRHAGFTEFQELAGVLIARHLTGASDAKRTMEELRTAYARSFT